MTNVLTAVLAVVPSTKCSNNQYWCFYLNLLLLVYIYC